MSYESSHNNEERVSSLFQPDTLLPTQYLETVSRRIYLDPEKKLMLAILEDSVTCYQKYIFARDGKGQNQFSEVENWILDKDGDWVFTFDSICESLDLNPNYVRGGLIRWKENTVANCTTTDLYRLVVPNKGEKKHGTMSHNVKHKPRKVINR